MKYGKLVNGNLEYANGYKNVFVDGYWVKEEIKDFEVEGFKPVVHIVSQVREGFTYEPVITEYSDRIEIEARETEISGYFEELAAEQLLHKRQEIESKIREYDFRRIRALIEPAVKDPAKGQTWLEYYNEQIISLRTELNNL
jgi:hypothetical protein